MKLSILGIVVGSGLFAGGFAMHDSDFNLTHYPESGGLFAPVYGTTTKQHTDNWEHPGYIMGLVGAAILTLSIDRLQNPDTDVTKAESKFRSKWLTLVGTGLMAGGWALLYQYSISMPSLSDTIPPELTGSRRCSRVHSCR